MDYKQNKLILEKLLKAQTSIEVKKIVENEDFFDNCKWIPYGGRTNNVGTIGGQMRRADNALMEKVSNSIDAILMKRCMEEGIDPRDKSKAPKTVDEAVVKFFGGKKKLRKIRSKFAKEWLRLTAEGKSDLPTITIIDKGEGQYPNAIKETILSLNKDIKERIPFVYGTYNQGGSSPLSFAGSPSDDLNYLQLVLTRRAKSLQDPEHTERYNHYGFTVVRKIFNYDAEKYIYEYFVDKNSEDIFSFPSQGPIEVADYDFSEGCVLKLYDYQLPDPGNIVLRNLNEFIEKKLPAAPLPIFLKESRPKFRGGKEYTIYGFKEKLRRNKSIVREGFPQNRPIDLGDIGQRNIDIYLIKHVSETDKSLSSYTRQKEKIFFVKDGLVLHTENDSWLRNECDLIDVSPYIFAFIDISSINPPLAQALHSSREKFKDNPTTREALNRLKIFFEDSMFQELDQEYASMSFESADTYKDKEFKKQIMKDIASQPELSEYFELGNDVPYEDEKPGEDDEVPYDGRYLPDKFELIGEDPKEIKEQSYGKVSFDTNASKDLFKREQDRGRVDWTESENLLVAKESFEKGRLTLRIDATNKVQAGYQEALIFKLSVPSKDIEFSRTVGFVIGEEEVYEGKEFPTFFTLVKEKIKLPMGAKRKISLKTDVENEYFDRSKSPGKLEVENDRLLKQGASRLNNGLLEIPIEYIGDKVQDVEEVYIFISDDNGNEFHFDVPVQILEKEHDPQLNLPELISINEKEWFKQTPVWDENTIATIPSWGELKKIKINMDSFLFKKLKKMNLPDKEKSRKILRNQVYISSIWLFLELSPLLDESVSSDDLDTAYGRSIRAIARVTLQNIKKLSR